MSNVKEFLKIGTNFKKGMFLKNEIDFQSGTNL
jgi:hypothetical protein